ncbi:unnamed protein product [Rhizoctonia solani]|uniref:F-box domain-containing protein n=1 Tax=Rhizoctonia solani TaxID=456999 RepID=A0A8H3CWE5_9AGAM|nr:unnamed protein product [Rhizoctonia solani]
MGTSGYFAYRYRGKYYRRYLSCDAYPSGYGQHFADAIPRDPSILEEWIADRIRILENAKISNEEVVHPDLSEDGSFSDLNDDALGYELREDLEWTLAGNEVEYTYVIDLDNRAFTINGTTHLKLDNMPPSDPGLRRYRKLPSQYLNTTVNFWPSPAFNIEERQKLYESVNPIVTPAVEWGAHTWDRLSISQRLSVDLTHHLISKTSGEMASAHIPSIREKTGRFCWDILCAATSSVPLFYDNPNLQSRWNGSLSSGHGNFPSYGMCYKTGDKAFKDVERGYRGDYCWVRGCLVTFCVRLSEHAYVVHEIEQMVQKMRHDEHPECLGIILSSQQEIIAVAVDDGLEPTRQVRHTPVLDIRPNPDKPGQASDGLLLLVHLLSPPLSVSPLPWRSRPSQSSLMWSRPRLPLEILQHIIRYTNTTDYLSLCRASRSIRSACLANPRFGDYTILYKLPKHELTYAARYVDKDKPLVLTIYWHHTPFHGASWKARVSPWEGVQDSSDKANVDETKAD